MKSLSALQNLTHKEGQGNCSIQEFDGIHSKHEPFLLEKGYQFKNSLNQTFIKIKPPGDPRRRMFLCCSVGFVGKEAVATGHASLVLGVLHQPIWSRSRRLVNWMAAAILTVG
jgi:hypothetical protein